MIPLNQDRRWHVLHLSWIAFFCTFFAWFAFASLVPLIQKDLGLSDVQVGWLASAGVALTIPGRIWVGRFVDWIGPRKAYSILLATLAGPVLLLAFAQNFIQLFALRLLIGVVGCGFVIGIRLIGDWFSKEELGLAEGIYGGWGNAGTALAALSLPLIAVAFGWRFALATASVPLLVWSVVFWRSVSDVPAGKVFRRTPRESAYSAWGDRNVRVLAFVYLASFGSELCVVSFLPKFFFDRFGLEVIYAGAFAAIFSGFNLVARPGGGWLSDRFGGKRVLSVSLVGAAGAYLFLGSASTLSLAIAGVALSAMFVQASNGAVFALVPLVSPTNTGRVAGWVGAAGNVGGVLFPLSFGYGLTVSSGSFLPGFVFVSLASLAALGGLLFLDTSRFSSEAHHGFSLLEGDSGISRVRMILARGSSAR